MYQTFEQSTFQNVGLRGVNCIYDDGTVLSMDEGPCQEVLDNGAQLVDRNIEETELTVTTPPPVDYYPIVLGLAALFLIGGRHVSRR